MQANDFETVAATNDIPVGQGKVYRVHGREIAIFNVDGDFYAIDNVCPHRGGPIGEGRLEHSIITCPWHDWSFDVRSGKSTYNPRVCLERFRVRVKKGQIQVSAAKQL